MCDNFEHHFRGTLRGTHGRGPLNLGSWGGLGSLRESLGSPDFWVPLYVALFVFPEPLGSEFQPTLTIPGPQESVKVLALGLALEEFGLFFHLLLPSSGL